MKLAQGILCGSWALAFDFDWSRQIVDQFECAPIPKAPVWLMGAANVEGNIVPVVDLYAYLHGTSPATRRSLRLLVGGLPEEASATADSTGDAFALAFEGLPQQLQYAQRPLTYASALPVRLRELCTGIATNEADQEFLELDTRRLMLALADELSQV